MTVKLKLRVQQWLRDFAGCPSAAVACRMLVVVLASSLMSACGELPRGHYALSVEEAFERLSNSLLPDFVRDRQCGILIHVSHALEENRSVTWYVKSSGSLMLSFKAKLTAVDDRTTKVDVSVSQESNGREAYDGTQFYKRPAVQQPVRPAIEEQISALLEGRRFDPTRAGTGTIMNKNGTFEAAQKDRVCLIQRSGLESGRVFSVDD